MKKIILAGLITILPACSLFEPKCKTVCPDWGDTWGVEKCEQVCEGDKSESFNDTSN